MDFINGWRYPIFKIYVASTNLLIDTITLPITNGSGLIEKVEEIKVVHDLLNHSFEEEVEGYRISWTLPYSEYANKTTMLKIQDLFRYRKGNPSSRLTYRINLTPRMDAPLRNFDVIYTGTDLSFGILKGGINAVGNKGMSIEWQTKDLVDDLGWVDPDAIVYSGFYLHNRFAVLKT